MHVGLKPELWHPVDAVYAAISEHPDADGTSGWKEAAVKPIPRGLRSSADLSVGPLTGSYPRVPGVFDPLMDATFRTANRCWGQHAAALDSLPQLLSAALP